MSRTLTRPAALAITVACLLPLAACSPAGNDAAPAAGTTTAGTATAGTATTATTATAAGTGTGLGSVTVAVTSPITDHGSTGASVSCASTGVTYVARAVNARVAGYAHSFTIRVARYRGPGSYLALATLTVVGPHGRIASATGVPSTPVTISATGGSFVIDTTGAQGRTLAATVSWTCP